MIQHALGRHYESQWTDLPRRMATICVGVPILWSIFLDDRLRRIFFYGLLVVILWEWTRITQSKSLWWSLLLLQAPDDLFLPALVASVAASQILTSNDPASGSSYMAGSFLITVPFHSWMRVQRHGFGFVVSLLLVTWNVDTGSLIAGRFTGAKGRPAWLTAISPGKSIAGLVGGFIGGVGTYASLGLFWDLVLRLQLAPTEAVTVHLNFGHRHSLLVGAMLSFTASMGDLWESSLKRQWGVKDTSKLLPGHGGIIDRFDSSLVAVLLYEYFINHGMV